MGIRQIKPTTPGQRGMSVSTFEELTAAWTRRRLAIVLDGEIASAPLVLSAIGGGRISLSVGRGDPDLQAALAAKLAKGLRGR